MTHGAEIELFDDRYDSGVRDIMQQEDPGLRSQALELWAATVDVTTEEKRFLPATVVQIADQFSEEEPEVARTALSAASVLLATGEISNDGMLDEEDLNSIYDVTTALTQVGLDGVSAVYMAERLGIATDLGGLKALKDLHEAIVELSQEEVDTIREELLLESGEYADEFVDDYEDKEDIASEDELEDAPEPIVEVRAEPTEETVAIQRLQLVLGHVGLTGVDIVMIAEHFAVPLDDADAVGEIIKEISHASDQELEELRFQSDADVVSRKPQDIAEALASYRKALAQIHDEHENVEDDSQGTTNTVVDDSGEEFEI